MSLVRGRAACEGCRWRKQKCDGKKPACSRCQDQNRTCVWPKAQKRGPVKGYVEALEHRLEVTENALLRLLAVSDEERLALAFRPDSEPVVTLPRVQSVASADAGSRAEVSKADLLAHWEQFPLTNLDEIRHWAKEALQAPLASSLRQESFEQAGDVDIAGGSAQAEGVPRQQVYSHTQLMPLPVDQGIHASTPSPVHSQNEAVHFQEAAMPAAMPTWQPAVTYPQQQASPARQEGHTNMQSAEQPATMQAQTKDWEEGEESLFLPLEFKQQYLW
ncbi:hypothetical protein VTK73DRAFT_225 [Phialemonium thermophilum]|uniref:Zn(2)-C6 fungal-type domain-containing protein n=1 Tax=Phialemonium thermophilum TaxID=223376 RepID=A0ABR3XFN5_9PEZI